MLARRLVAGPSCPLRVRGMAMAAAVEAPHAGYYGSSESVQPVPPSPKPTLSPVRQLVQVAQSLPSRQARGEAWGLYRSLTPAQRASLSSAELKVVLRAVVPKSGEAVKLAHDAAKRQRYSLNRKQATQWETRLRALMSDLVQRNDADLNDWVFVLSALQRVGYVAACESIAREMPENLQRHRAVLEARLGAVIRWARNLEDTARRPRPKQVEVAHAAFWDVFSIIHDGNVELRPYTLRLLLEATSELSQLVGTLGNNSSTTRFDAVMRLVFSQGYGLDLDDLPMSVEQKSMEQSRSYPHLSSKSINAVLSHLLRQGTPPHRLLSMFELLTTDSKTEFAAKARGLDAEEEDEYVPCADTDDIEARRNWLGQRVRPADPTFFDASSPQADDELPHQAPDDARFLRDFLPTPIAPLSVLPATSLHADKLRYDANAILILLRATTKSDNLQLAIHILEMAILDVQRANSSWLAVYLACPPSLRHRLQRPHRIPPEWFHVVLAQQARCRGRFSSRLASTTSNVISWVEQEISVLRSAEEDGDVVTSAGSTTAMQGGAADTQPLFATRPRAEQLYDHQRIVEQRTADLAKLAAHLRRADQLALKRSAARGSDKLRKATVDCATAG